jgi:hypothetical protein
MIVMSLKSPGIQYVVLEGGEAYHRRAVPGMLAA